MHPLYCHVSSAWPLEVHVIGVSISRDANGMLRVRTWAQREALRVEVLPFIHRVLEFAPAHHMEAH